MVAVSPTAARVRHRRLSHDTAEKVSLGVGLPQHIQSAEGTGLLKLRSPTLSGLNVGLNIPGCKG